LKVGSGLQPERRATTKGDVNDNNKEEGLSTSDEESRSDGKGGIEAKWRQKLEATTNHSRQYEEALGDNSQQEVAWREAESQAAGNMGTTAGNKIINNCTITRPRNGDGGWHSSRQRGDRWYNNQPLMGALKAGSGLWPERWAMTNGEDNDNNEKEGLFMLDKESLSNGKGGIEAKWRQKLEATTNHSRQYEEAPGDNSQQEVEWWEAEAQAVGNTSINNCTMAGNNKAV
jgi:hypothetical protein